MTLAAALEAEHLQGVAIDMFASEPRAELSPLVIVPRTVFAPHLLGWTVDMVDQLGRWATDAVTEYLGGADLPRDSIVC